MCSPLPVLPQALAVRLADLVAGGAGEALSADVDALEAAVAAPPLGLHVALLEPLGRRLGALLGQVLLVVVAQVVAQPLGPVEGVLVARALLVVAEELLLVLVADVHRLVVAVEVGDALEGDVFAVRRQADVLPAVVGAAAGLEGWAHGVEGGLGHVLVVCHWRGECAVVGIHDVMCSVWYRPASSRGLSVISRGGRMVRGR